MHSDISKENEKHHNHSPCRCFPHGGSHQRVNLYACLPFPDGDAKRHKNLSWFGQEKALRPAGGGESLCYFAPKCLYRGEYKLGMEYGSSTTYECSVVSMFAPGLPLL